MESSNGGVGVNKRFCICYHRREGKTFEGFGVEDAKRHSGRFNNAGSLCKVGIRGDLSRAEGGGYANKYGRIFSSDDRNVTRGSLESTDAIVVAY
jgi:hypothetical protein